MNESEAQIILGQEDPIETEADIEKAMNLLLLKCPIIVITLGKFLTASSLTQSKELLRHHFCQHAIYPI